MSHDTRKVEYKRTPIVQTTACGCSECLPSLRGLREQQTRSAKRLQRRLRGPQQANWLLNPIRNLIRSQSWIPTMSPPPSAGAPRGPRVVLREGKRKTALRHHGGARAVRSCRRTRSSTHRRKSSLSISGKRPCSRAPLRRSRRLVARRGIPVGARRHRRMWRIVPRRAGGGQLWLGCVRAHGLGGRTTMTMTRSGSRFLMNG